MCWCECLTATQMTHVASTTRPLHNKIIKKGTQTQRHLQRQQQRQRATAIAMRATLQLTSMSTSMAMLEEAMAMATWTCRAAARCHWRRACKAVHFTERDRSESQQRPKATQQGDIPPQPARPCLLLCPCSLARSCFNNFHAATTKKTTSVEEGEAEAGAGAEERWI